MWHHEWEPSERTGSRTRPPEQSTQVYKMRMLNCFKEIIFKKGNWTTSREQETIKLATQIWKRAQVGERLLENRQFALIPRYYSTDYLLITKWKVFFTIETYGCYHLHHLIKTGTANSKWTSLISWVDTRRHDAFLGHPYQRHAGNIRYNQSTRHWTRKLAGLTAKGQCQEKQH